MKKPLAIVLVAACLVSVAPDRGAAQAAWDSPSFMRPGAPSGLTVALTDAEGGPALGLLASWRNAAAPSGLGFRAGIAEGPDDDLVGILGVDISHTLSGPTEAGSPEVLWWAGAGVGLGGDLSASFPLGLVFGWTANDGGVSFMPYAGGHLVLDVLTGAGDDLNLEGVVDLGLDVGLARGWIVRVGAALGGRESLAFGARIPR